MTASPTGRCASRSTLTIAGDRMVLDFSGSAPPCDGPLNIARSTTIASCYVALKHIFTDVPANGGCLEPIAFVIPDTTLLGVSAPRPVAGYTETILRSHRRHLRRLRQSRARARQWQSLRHHQCAVARRLARGPSALDHVLLLRRRPWRQPGERRAQSQQQSDLDRDDPAGGNPEIALSGDVHPMGAAAGFRRPRTAPRRAWCHLRDRGFGRGRRRRLSDRRARQISAVRRQWRRPGGAQSLHL